MRQCERETFGDSNVLVRTGRRKPGEASSRSDRATARARLGNDEGERALFSDPVVERGLGHDVL